LDWQLRQHFGRLTNLQLLQQLRCIADWEQCEKLSPSADIQSGSESLGFAWGQLGKKRSKIRHNLGLQQIIELFEIGVAHKVFSSFFKRWETRLSETMTVCVAISTLHVNFDIA
jgi:hypothetical protein